MTSIRPLYKYFASAIGVLLIVLVIIAYLNKAPGRTYVKVVHVRVDSLENIQPVQDSLVIPYVYDSVTILGRLTLEERKKKFVDVMLPAILIIRQHLLEQEKRLRSILDRIKANSVIEPEDTLFISGLMNVYRVKDTADLIMAVHPHPVSITLAQAALESGWGSSRFFRQANNIFGIWSFDSEEPRIRATFSREEKAVFLKKYNNLLASVKDYYEVIGKGRVYLDFRKKRFETNNVFELIWYLKYYSEKRSQYVIMLRNVIVANDFLKYDHYRLHPDYFEYI